jgi:C4-dicarboxylate transporter
MAYIQAFFRFWYDFLVGDDWRIAAGIVLTLAFASAVARSFSPFAAGVVVLIGVLLTGAVALYRAEGTS